MLNFPDEPHYMGFHICSCFWLVVPAMLTVDAAGYRRTHGSIVPCLWLLCAPLNVVQRSRTLCSRRLDIMTNFSTNERHFYYFAPFAFPQPIEVSVALC